jgi:hypothetical protein
MFECDLNAPGHDRRPSITQSKSTLKQRALVASYLTAAAVAMLGWLSAFGWVVTEIAKLLLIS